MEKLQQIDSISYSEVAFGEIIKDLGKKWDVQFFLHPCMEGGETTVDTPITLDLKYVTLKTVLQLLLDPKDLDFQIKNGMVVIATKEEVNRHLEVRVYDVDDLLGLASSFSPNSTHKTGGSNLVKPTVKEEGDAAKVSNEKTASGKSPVAVKCPLTSEDKLISVITSIVEPITWGVQGLDGTGAIQDFGGLLIVTNTAPVHEKIEELLTNMRRAIGESKKQ